MPQPADCLIAASDAAREIRLVSEADFADAAARTPRLAAEAALSDFKGQSGRLLLTLDEAAKPLAYFGLGDGSRPGGVMALKALAAGLPAGDWILAEPHVWPLEDMALAFALGAYSFDRYKSGPAAPRPRLVAGAAADVVLAQAGACALARDLVNTPASDMGPAELEAAARAVAQSHGADLAVTTGPDLLRDNYPSVHAVGRAAAENRAPRFIEMSWRGPGATDASPLVALVGKGVTFDTGGLDLKPSSGMRWMKKDMGGAAHALALAQMIMQAGLPIRLSLLIPAVENAVSGDAMRPGDVLATRKGLTVEVGNTDAEGRLILADALTRAAELSPDLTIDMATLTGAARVALGPEVVPFFTDDESLAEALAAAGRRVSDPVWRLPLWEGYEEALDSDVADLKNDPDGWAQAGAVTAALYLRRFAPKGAWVHFDLFAWRPRKQPGRPFGAEAQAIRALFAVILARYGRAA